MLYLDFFVAVIDFYNCESFNDTYAQIKFAIACIIIFNHLFSKK